MSVCSDQIKSLLSTFSLLQHWCYTYRNYAKHPNTWACCKMSPYHCTNQVVTVPNKKNQHNLKNMGKGNHYPTIPIAVLLGQPSSRAGLPNFYVPSAARHIHSPSPSGTTPAAAGRWAKSLHNVHPPEAVLRHRPPFS